MHVYSKWNQNQIFYYDYVLYESQTMFIECSIEYVALVVKSVFLWKSSNDLCVCCLAWKQHAIYWWENDDDAERTMPLATRDNFLFFFLSIFALYGTTKAFIITFIDNFPSFRPNAHAISDLCALLLSFFILHLYFVFNIYFFYGNSLSIFLFYFLFLHCFVFFTIRKFVKPNSMVYIS